MYSADRDWEARVTPMLIQCVADLFGGQIRPANAVDDMLYGTDFLWYRKGKTHRLATRVRRHWHLKYKDDFTIREGRPWSGHSTELEKIRKTDWADLYAYAFSDGEKILYWSLFKMIHFNPDAPFTYMPGYGPSDKSDTITRVYRIADQPEGFCRGSWSLVDGAIPNRVAA